MTAGFHLPDLPYLPGRTPRPDEAVFAAVKTGLDACKTAEDFRQTAAFRAGLACLDAGYFWEAHEVWEAVWIRLPPASRERLVMQALIQVANAGLKQRMGKPAASARIMVLAESAWHAGFATSRGPVLGFVAADWRDFIRIVAL